MRSEGPFRGGWRWRYGVGRVLSLWHVDGIGDIGKDDIDCLVVSCFLLQMTFFNMFTCIIMF